MSWIYVHYYNEIGIGILTHFHEHLTIALEYYLTFQRFAFLVPLVGAIQSLVSRKAKFDLSYALFPTCLWTFSVGWVLLGFLLWRAQNASLPVAASWH